MNQHGCLLWTSDDTKKKIIGDFSIFGWSTTRGDSVRRWSRSQLRRRRLNSGHSVTLQSHLSRCFETELTHCVAFVILGCEMVTTIDKSIQRVLFTRFLWGKNSPVLFVQILSTAGECLIPSGIGGSDYPFSSHFRKTWRHIRGMMYKYPNNFVLHCFKIKKG